jgi:hypothetical protein
LEAWLCAVQTTKQESSTNSVHLCNPCSIKTNIVTKLHDLF